MLGVESEAVDVSFLWCVVVFDFAEDVGMVFGGVGAESVVSVDDEVVFLVGCDGDGWEDGSCAEPLPVVPYRCVV